MNDESVLIDDFFNGLLDRAGEKEVRRRAETDPGFGKEFALRQKMEDFLESQPARKNIEEQLAALGEEFFVSGFISENKEAKRPEAKVVPMWRWLAAAAAAAVLFVAVWFGTRPKISVYQEFAQHAPLQINVRSTDAGKTTADAESDFNSKNYARALENLETLSKNQPDDLTLQLYRAICLIELGRSDEARQLLGPIVAGTSARREDARWYLAMSFLKEKNKAQCLHILEGIQPGESHFEDAQKLRDEE